MPDDPTPSPAPKAATADKNKLATPELKGYRLRQALRMHAGDADAQPIGSEVQLDDDTGADLVARGIAEALPPPA